MILSYDLLKPEDEKEDNKDKTSIKEEIDLFNQCKSFYYYPVGRRIRSVHLFKE